MTRVRGIRVMPSWQAEVKVQKGVTNVRTGITEFESIVLGRWIPVCRDTGYGTNLCSVLSPYHDKEDGRDCEYKYDRVQGGYHSQASQGEMWSS